MYREPLLGSWHDLRDNVNLQEVALEDNVGADVSDAAWPLARLYDGLRGRITKSDTALTTTIVRWNRGSAQPRVDLNYVLIPPGHNLHAAVSGGGSVTWEQDNDVNFPTPDVKGTVDLSTVAAGEPIALHDPTDGQGAQRHHRLTIVTTNAIQVELGEVFATRADAWTYGPAPTWTVSKQPTERRNDLVAGGTAVQTNGPERLRYLLQFVATEEPDLTSWRSFLDSVGWGTARAFLVAGPDDHFPPAWMLFDSDVEQFHDFRAPKVGLSYTTALDLVEQIR